jgi:hypothetical protein
LKWFKEEMYGFKKVTNRNNLGELLNKEQEDEECDATKIIVAQAMTTKKGFK